MQVAKYNCGCEFPLDENNKVIFTPEIEKLPLDCSLTWNVICNGDTKGIFQLESHLGRSLAKQALPRSIEELSDLISIMRPGCLESVMDGKTLTHHYIDRKHGKDKTTYYHRSLEKILGGTYGILVYQEQAMNIAKELAGFNLQEADNLRKAIGKKKPEEMAKIKILFMTKAKEVGIINEEEAIEIFNWIEKSQRYSFNKSHSVAYAVDGYISAYAKAHFPKEFLTAYLVHSREESDFGQEVKELISNAKNYDIEVLPPNIKLRNSNFKIYGENIICGLSNIKGVGESVLKNIDKTILDTETALSKKIDQWSWIEFLLYCAYNIKNDAMIAMISVGALTHFGISRRKMLYELEQVKNLTERDIGFLKQVAGNSILERLKVISTVEVARSGPICSKKKKESIGESIKILENPPYVLKDTAVWISEIEQSLLGIALTCSKVDDCDASSANCTCKDFLNGQGGPLLIACQVDEVREHIIKNGPKKGGKMAFLKVSDSYGSLDSVLLFTEQWNQCKDVLIENNTVILVGVRDKKNKDTLVVNKVWQI